MYSIRTAKIELFYRKMSYFKVSPFFFFYKTFRGFFFLFDLKNGEEKKIKLQSYLRIIIIEITWRKQVN